MTPEDSYETCCTRVADDVEGVLERRVTRFRAMCAEHGSVEATKRLIHAQRPSDTFSDLWMNGRLDLTVEVVILTERSAACGVQVGGRHVIEQVGVLQWDLEQIADSLHLTVQDTRKYFTDGRRVSFILERRICREIIGGRLSPSEGAGFDLIDAHERKWEVRSITKGGIYFCPSYMVGSGRKFDECGFLKKLDEIEGYVVSDVTRFPNIPIWKLQVETVRRWYENRNLGTGTNVSRSRALALLKA